MFTSWLVFIILSLARAGKFFPASFAFQTYFVFPPITLSECPCMLGVKIVDYLQTLMLADLFSVCTVKNAQNIKLKSHKVDENLWKASSIRSNPELKYNN